MTATQDRTGEGVATVSSSATTAATLRAIVQELAGQYFERDEVIRVLMQTVLAGQHALLLGPPGTGKSALVRELTSRISGATYWEMLLTKFTDPKKIFGPVDVAALTQGVYRQMLEGRATTAHIAFLDEVFKAGAGALNELLAFLNERLYHPENGEPPIACPLISAITASNELPPTDETAAMYDRLLVRVQVDYLQDPSNFGALMQAAVRRGAPAARSTVTLAELQHAVNIAVPAVDVPDTAIDLLIELRTVMRRKELVSSDRRWEQAVRLLQAGAWLDGRNTVEARDLSVLSHVLWDSPAQRRTVERDVLELVDPDARKVLDLVDGIVDIENELNAKQGESADKLSTWATKEANKKLGAADRQLQQIKTTAQQGGRSTTTVDAAMAQLKSVQARVYVEALGINPSALNAQP